MIIANNTWRNYSEMKKLQNSLYITKQKTYVHKERETIVISLVLQIPIHSIKNIFCFGNVMISPFFMGHCGDNGVGISFYTEYGKFLGRFQGRESGNILLRKAQYRTSESVPEQLSQVFIAAKVANSRYVLQRHLRNHGGNEMVSKAIRILNQRLEAIKSVTDVDKIRGLEGDAAAVYFKVFGQLLTNSNDGFEFSGRNRRPPKDPVNAMLSFSYSLLGNELSSALQGVGLDPQAGFLHTDRPGRDSLAQDILEEFRAWWADRFVLSLINRRQVLFKDFEKQASGAVVMKDDTRKVFLQAWQSKKQEEIMHLYLNEKIQVGLLPHVQALLLARHIRGDIKCYPPFVVR